MTPKLRRLDPNKVYPGEPGDDAPGFFEQTLEGALQRIDEHLPFVDAIACDGDADTVVVELAFDVEKAELSAEEAEGYNRYNLLLPLIRELRKIFPKVKTIEFKDARVSFRRNCIDDFKNPGKYAGVCVCKECLKPGRNPGKGRTSAA